MRLNKEPASRMASCLLSRQPLWLLSLVLIVQFSGCTTTSTEDDNTTNTFITVVSVNAVAGDFTEGQESDFLNSDVCASDEDNPPCTVFNDNAIVTFEGRPKDLTSLSSPTNDVVFERYRVTYIRSDGQNVPGVDVPFPFDGVSSFRVTSDATEVERAFVVVRHQAKRETPLREISENSAGILSVLAQMDFFGRDGAGRNIQVTAFLNITFADFANE